MLSYITVRGPDLEAVYDVVRDEGIVSFDSLAELFCMPEEGVGSVKTGQLRDCLNLLRAIDILDVTKPPKTENYKLEEGLKHDSFPILLLNKLRLAKDRSFYEVQRLIVRKDILHVHVDELKRIVESALDLNFAWTVEKLNFWMSMAHFLGLGRRSYRRFVCYPKPDLIENLLQDFFANNKAEQAHPRDFFNYVSSEFFECLTEQGQLFQGFQQTMSLLERKGTVRLIPLSDDPNPIQVGKKHVSLLSIMGG